MIFAYGKSPLGVVFRFVRVVPIALCRTREEAMNLAESLKSKLQCKLEVVEVDEIDSYYKIALLDPDYIDLVNSSVKYVVLAEWI